jgi:hypothetical protein
MSENDNQRLLFQAFNLGREITTHVLGDQTESAARVLETLQSIADGEETLLESPSDTAAWFQQQEKDREQIIKQIGPQAFENMRLHAERAKNSDFATERDKEIALANAVLDSHHGRKPPAP